MLPSQCLSSVQWWYADAFGTTHMEWEFYLEFKDASTNDWVDASLTIGDRANSSARIDSPRYLKHRKTIIGAVVTTAENIYATVCQTLLPSSAKFNWFGLIGEIMSGVKPVPNVGIWTSRGLLRMVASMMESTRFKILFGPARSLASARGGWRKT